MDFKSRAVMSLVELHERELRAYLETWRRFAASDAPMPAANGDPNYESRETLGAHVLRAARGYLTWMGECAGRPVTDVDLSNDAPSIYARGPEFAEEVLAAWRRHMPAFTTEEIEKQGFKSRWGEPYTIEQMLEHAVVHPMRHRVQLQRILDSRPSPSTKAGQ